MVFTIDLTNDEFDDCNFKDPGLTIDLDFNASYDDGIDAHSNPNLFRCHKPNDENLQHSLLPPSKDMKDLQSLRNGLIKSANYSTDMWMIIKLRTFFKIMQ